MKGDNRNLEAAAAKLLEDGWFFGNLLQRKPKILRSNSEPLSSKKSEKFLRAPSLPPNFGKKKNNLDEEEEDEFGPRMGDLIRQAMPCKLSKAPSLPISRTKKEASFKLPRISSLDSSLLMPRYHSSSKGMKQNFSDPHISKNLQLRRSELPNRKSKSTNISRSVSLSDTELQGFQDLGFTFEADRIEVVGKNSVSETQWAYSPPVPKWIDTKSSDQDMKEQIKFWAKSVASNVSQELSH